MKNMATEMRNLQTNIHNNEYEINGILECLYDWEMRIAEINAERQGINIVNNSKHTPGPWSNTGLQIRAKNSLILANVYKHLEVNQSKAEAEANARLIAAAPETAAERDKLKSINAELLGACKYVIEWHEAQDPDNKELDYLSACITAIHKATGER